MCRKRCRGGAPPQSGRGQHGHDAAIQGRALEGTASVVHEQRLGHRAAAARIQHELWPVRVHEILHEQAQGQRHVHGSILPRSAADEKRRLPGADDGVADRQLTQFTIAEAGKEQRLDQQTIASGQRGSATAGNFASGPQAPQQLGRFILRQEHAAGNVPWQPKASFSITHDAISILHHKRSDKLHLIGQHSRAASVRLPRRLFAAPPSAVRFLQLEKNSLASLPIAWLYIVRLLVVADGRARLPPSRISTRIKTRGSAGASPSRQTECPQGNSP